MYLLKKSDQKFSIALIITLLLCPFSLYALPEVDNIEGQVQLESPNSSTLNVTTLFDKAIINWKQFNIALNETVNFFQPAVSSSVLNRDLSGSPSSILGNLFSNGNVILVNPSGINIGPQANINAASIIASTLDISNSDFKNDNLNFSKISGLKGASILNQGNIIVRDGGYVGMLASAVENKGAIIAKLGSVTLAAGEKMTLALDDINEFSVTIEEPVKEIIFGFDGNKIDSAVKNSGKISADGGHILLTARLLNKIFDYAINNTGIIEANSVEKHDGVVELVAEGAPVINSGTIKAGEVRAQVTGTGFINQGQIQAEKVEVKVESGEFINKEKIVADGFQGMPNGGKISILASTILQQGLISANAYEEGTAGEITMVSQSSTVLDEGSSTEARALGLAGNGGRILIDSTGGNTTVNKNAVIDVSAGAISGNGGFIEVSAFDQLGFFGILNGRAPPGYKPGKAFFDPQYFYLHGTISANLVAIAWDDIIIDGNVDITGAYTVELYANRNDDGSWHSDNIGTIRRTGDYTISGSSAYLILSAGSGIGSSTSYLKTNVAKISAETYSGNIYISQGSNNLAIGDGIAAWNGDVYLTAGGSILDDSSTVEHLLGICTDGDDIVEVTVPTPIYGNNVTISALNGNIGGIGVEGSLEYAIPMLDVGLGSGTLTATAGGNVYIMAVGKLIGTTYYADVSSSKYSLNSTGVNNELGLANYWGSLTIDQSYSGDDSRGFGCNTDLYINANIVTSASGIKFYAVNNINIAANLSSTNRIEIIADLYGNSTGAITQAAGKIGSGAESLILYAAGGIGTSGNPLQTQVASLQATNTTSGNINITNTGTLTLTTIDDSRLPDSDPYYDNDYYSIWNAGTGNVNIAATGVDADLIGSGIGKTLCAIRAKGNIVVTAGRDILLGEDLNNKWADIYTDAGDVTLTVGRDIKMHGGSCWLGSDKVDGTITLNAGRDVSLATVGFYLGDDLSGRNGGTVTILAGGSILDDSTTFEIKDGSVPTFIKANTINLTATNGDIGSFNNDGNSLDEMTAPLFDVYLGSGVLTATASLGSIYIQDYKSAGVTYTPTKYQLNCKDPSETEYNEIIFVNLAGPITISSTLNLSDNQRFAALGDITINSSITSSAGVLGFHATGNLNINSNITVNGANRYDPDESKTTNPGIDLEADMDRVGGGNINIGPVTLRVTKGGGLWIYGKDVAINNGAVIDAKGEGPNLETEICVESSASSEDMFLGNGAV